MTRQGSHLRSASSGNDGKAVDQAAVLDLPAEVTAGGNEDDLEREILRLVEASRQGRLGERGNAEHFEGRSRRVIEGINEMLNAILLPIGEGNRVLAQISAGRIDE